mgnify:CR=1 FL=1
MSEAKQIYHVPVLLNESVDGMNIQPGGIYVDATFGGGGHSKEILSRLDSTAHLYSFDQDEDAEKNIVSDSRFTFVRSNFRYLSNFLRYYDVEEVDAMRRSTAFWPIWAFPHITLTTPNVDSHSASRAN